MSDKRDISEFLQHLDHEFKDVAVKLNQQGYKIDGNQGIKVHCNMRNFKSADYFYLDCQDSKLIILEFSDLYAQRQQIDAQIAALKTSDLDKSTRRTLIKQQHTVIHKELVDKFKDTLHILSQLNDYFDNIPQTIGEKPQRFLIVVPPFTHYLNIDDVDMVRILDALQDKVKQALQGPYLPKVKILPLDRAF